MSNVLVERMESQEHGGRYSAAVRCMVLDAKPRVYVLFVTTTYVTVIFDPDNRRNLGKTFHAMNADETTDQLKRAYKRDGGTLAELTTQARECIAAAVRGKLV